MEVFFFDKTVEFFIFQLEKLTIAKVLRTIDLLEHFGSELGMPHSKKISPQIFELRIRGKQEVRLLYSFRKNGVVILSGFVEKSQKIPKKELFSAQENLRLFDRT